MNHSKNLRFFSDSWRCHIRGFLNCENYQDETGERYMGYNFTEKGWSWTLLNKNKFLLQKPKEKPEIPF